MKENHVLRQELRGMNDQLNDVIEVVKDYKIRKAGGNKARFTKEMTPE